MAIISCTYGGFCNYCTNEKRQENPRREINTEAEGQILPYKKPQYQNSAAGRDDRGDDRAAHPGTRQSCSCGLKQL